VPSFGERFGALIAAKREERGWSFATLAIEAYGDNGQGGESRKADVQKLEAGGSKKPNAATIRKYRLALDLTQDEIDACRTPEEVELAQFARDLFDVIADAAQAAGLSEDYALAVAERYAEGNPHDFKGALAGLKSALEDKMTERNRPSNLPPDDMLAEIEAMNDAGDIDEADAAIEAYMDTRRTERRQRDAEDSRILIRAISQAVATRNPDKYADRTLELIQLDSPSAKDSFDRLRYLCKERYQNGLRHGTPFALTAAIGLARKSIDIAPTPDLIAMAHNDLGNTLWQQGTRTAGREGAALLAEAVYSYRAALRVRTETDHPVDWAMTMQNLANARQEQGSRTAGREGAALLSEAVDSYRAALRVYTEADHPVDWAASVQNLAIALELQGTRTAGPEGAGLLAKAVDSYRAALRVYTEADHPVDWARSMQNLAGALQQQGTGTGTAGPEGAALLADAVDSYRAALRVTTEADHPVDWAMTQANLALLELAWSKHESTEDPRSHLERAVEYNAAALSVFDATTSTYYHEAMTKDRDRIQAALDALPSSSS